MACVQKIAGSVANTCDAPSVGGIIENFTIMNKSDFDLATVTYASGNQYLIEALVKATGKPAYTFAVVADSAQASATKVDNGLFDQKVIGMVNCATNAIKKQLLDMDGGRYVIIVERRNPVAEMKFQVYGATCGLKLNAFAEDSNANNGNVSLEFATSADSKEQSTSISLFKTDLATTRTILTTLVTP